MIVGDGTFKFPSQMRLEGGNNVIITVSRQMGSGGEEIGRRVARRLGFPYYDQAIAARVAILAKVSREAVGEVDEAGPTMFAEIVTNLMTAYALEPEMGVVVMETGPWLRHDICHRLTEDVIRGLASQGSGVVVGRGSQIILQENQRAFHVHIVAPFESRVWRVMKREGLGQKEAENVVRDSDQSRARYIRKYYKADWHDSSLYHLVLNTARIDEETAASAIIEGVHLRNSNITFTLR